MNTPILCIPRAAFHEFHGFHPPDENHYIGKMLTIHPDEENIAAFIPRDEAETSEDWIQIIPYCLFICGQDVFIYSRNKKGGEARLHEKLSVGVGGHIEQHDHEEPLTAYLNGTIREIQEEVGLDIPVQALANTAIGLLHDPETPVGRVHLGVLHALHISIEQMMAILAHAEESMSNTRFTNLLDLADLEDVETLAWKCLEPWSQWSIEYVAKLMSKPKPWENPGVLERLRYLNLTAAEIARSSAELLLQHRGPNWIIAKENLEKAVGSLACVLSGLSTHKDLSMSAITQAEAEFYASMKTSCRHQDWNVASTQFEK